MYLSRGFSNHNFRSIFSIKEAADGEVKEIALEARSEEVLKSQEGVFVSGEIGYGFVTKPKGIQSDAPRKKSKKKGQSKPIVEPPFAIQSAGEDISWNAAYEADLSQQSTSTTWRSRSFWFATLLITAVGTALVFDGKISSVSPAISSSVSSDTSNALDPATFWQQRSQSSIKSDYRSHIVEQVELEPFESNVTTQSSTSGDSFEGSYPFFSYFAASQLVVALPQATPLITASIDNRLFGMSYFFVRHLSIISSGSENSA